MKTGALISVIIPCFNQARYLPETLKSVLSQEGVSTEVIVVDDGSTDETEQVLASYHTQIKYLKQANAGVGAARNRGLDEASGEFLYFLDGDDLVAPTALKELSEALIAHEEWSGVVCSTSLTDEQGRLTGRELTPPETKDWFLELSRRPCFCVGAILLRRSAWPDGLRFETGLKSCEDWDLWLQLARAGASFGVLPRPLFRYRMRPAGKSKKPIPFLTSYEAVLRRARTRDARVPCAAKEWENGAPADDLDACIEGAVLLSLGSAMAGGDAEVAIELFERLRGPTHKPLGIGHFQGLRAQMASVLGEESPDQLVVYRRCWEVLEAMDKRLPEKAPLRAVFPQIVRGLLGISTIAAERDLWKENYHRLATAFPVKQLLWLRRRLLGQDGPLAPEP